MAALARSLSTRVARIEKPKPLKNIVANRHSFSDKECMHPSPESVDFKTPDTPAKGGAEEVLMVLDIVSSCIVNKDYYNITPLTNNLSHSFKSYGSQLEEYYKEKLDKIFDIIRNGAHDMCIDRQGRVNLLHLIEIRASLYQLSPGAAAYYAINSGLHPELGEVCGDIGYDTSQQQLLGPGDVLKSSGKYSSPTRVPGKNYCKDEVVIRNSDSGKVMGIKGRRVHMIEELSETVISFQRVNPGAKERLVQITGPSEDKIVYAKNLIEDTIKRNASPVRELGIGMGGYQEAAGSNSSINSSASDESNRLQNVAGGTGKEVPEYKYSVHVQNEVIHISSTNLNLLNEAFSFLDSSYSTLEDPSVGLQTLSATKVIQSSTFTPLKTEIPSSTPTSSPVQPSSNEKIHSENNIKETPEDQELKETYQNANGVGTSAGFLIQYSREFLLQCSKNKVSQMTPSNWAQIISHHPTIVKQSLATFDAVTYQKRWLEMEGRIAAVPAIADDLDSD